MAKKKDNKNKSEKTSLRSSYRTRQIMEFYSAYGEDETLKHFNIQISTLKRYLRRYRQLNLEEDIESLKELDLINVDRRLKKYAKERRYSNKKYNKALDDIERLRTENEILTQFKSHVPDISKIVSKKSDKFSESTAVAVMSDLHFEEQVDPSTVNYLNEYSPEIAEMRAHKFFKSIVRLTEIQRAGTDINELILAILGDLIAGYIHEELEESNFLSPTEASLRVFDILISGINYLLENGKFKKIYVICKIGNHGRTTKKRRVSTSHKNSYEWLIYKYLERYFEHQKGLEIIVPSSYLYYFQVYDQVLRFHHGDNIRYNGGVGGITIPVNKAIAQWNKSKHADIDVFGHFHSSKIDKHFVANGSIVGFNSYALSIKAEFEQPQQMFFLVSKKYGMTVSCPLILTE